MEIKLLGVPVRVSFWFFVVLFSFLMIDKTGVASHILVAVAIHEGSHLIVMRLVGERLHSVSFRPFGITVRRAGSPVSYRAEALIYLAGPLANLITAGITCITQGFTLFCAVNVAIVAFNLMPVPPLDGGNIMAALLRQHTGFAAARAICFAVAAVVLLPLGYFAVQLYRFNGNITLAVTCLYLVVQTVVMRRQG